MSYRVETASAGSELLKDVACRLENLETPAGVRNRRKATVKIRRNLQLGFYQSSIFFLTIYVSNGISSSGFLRIFIVAFDMLG